MQRKAKFQGSLPIPGDKSISHRGLIFSLLAKGQCRIENLSPAEDCRSTIGCLERLGVTVTEHDSGSVTIVSPSVAGLQSPQHKLDARNSGTTIRLLSGLLAGTPMLCTLDGDESLRKRPMRRVLDPLGEMGAEIKYVGEADRPPFTLVGSQLKGMSFTLPVASAQVQTALLLAGLQADGKTSVTLPAAVRDHTERLFEFIGVPFSKPNALTIEVSRLKTPIPPFELRVAGDMSSAAFFMVAAACAEGSRVELLNVGMNEGRTLAIDVLREMGAQIDVVNFRQEFGEPIADVVIAGNGPLKDATIAGDRIAAGVDEIPILALAGCFSRGTFTVKDAQELRVKESDRLAVITNNLKLAGANVQVFDDGFTIEGTGNLKGGSQWTCHQDHRMAMTGMVANLLCETEVSVDDPACAAVSYPKFKQDLHSLCTY